MRSAQGLEKLKNKKQRRSLSTPLFNHLYTNVLSDKFRYPVVRCSHRVPDARYSAGWPGMLVRPGIRIGRILPRLIGLRLGLRDLSYRSWHSTLRYEPEFTDAGAISHNGTDTLSA